MSTEQHGRHRRHPATVLAVLLLLVGAVLLTVGLHAQHHAPQPPASAAIPLASAAATSQTTGPATVTGRPSSAVKGSVLPAAVPTRVDIPAIAVSSDLLPLGLNPDRTVQVPPLGKDSKAGWYTGSPTPGELGPSLLLGHVDSAQYGPGVFFNLGALRPGDTVEVTRADHTVAVFRVDRVASYPKDHFPILEVYGNTTNAQLRLITCGGKFDLSAHSYDNNIVVFASLVSSHPA